MASPELKWAIDKIAADRAAAGVRADVYDVAAARAANPPTDLPVPEGIRERWFEVEGVRCVWVTPRERDGDRRVVYFHGGGYCAAGYHSHRTLACWLAEHARAAVLFVEYRLAPEHRFPAQIDDGWTAYRHALAHGPDGPAAQGPAPHVAGDSAGGGLAVAIGLRARETGERMPTSIAALCGMLDFDESTSAFIQSAQRTREMTRSVVSRLSDLRHPWLSPVRADPRGLPPVLLQTGTADYCRDDSERFARVAQAAGVDTTLTIWPDMIHVWQRFAPRLPEATRALEEVAGFLRRAEIQP